ncbi:MAG: ATP-binding cassette domain-containing protein, partial [Atribacterota bacterium]|nr:ATP-binding cassette domain-containing protein [Atribacterota bacterium]
MTLISISNLTFVYDNSIEPIFQDVSLQIDTSWKLGLIGRNGRGKTTFLKILNGEYQYKGAISPIVECDYFPFNNFKKTE